MSPSSQTCQIGLNFASEEEAKRFRAAINDLLNRRQRKTGTFHFRVCVCAPVGEGDLSPFLPGLLLQNTNQLTKASFPNQRSSCTGGSNQPAAELEEGLFCVPGPPSDRKPALLPL